MRMELKNGCLGSIGRCVMHELVEVGPFFHCIPFLSIGKQTFEKGKYPIRNQKFFFLSFSPFRFLSLFFGFDSLFSLSSPEEE